MSTELSKVKINVENALQYLRGMTEGSLASAMEGFSEDVSYRGIERRDGGIYRRLYHGKPAVERYIGAWLKSAPGGVKYEIRSVQQLGDGVFIHWVDSAKGGEGQYANEGMLVCEFDSEGKVNHARSYSGAAPLKRWNFLGDKDGAAGAG